MAASEKTKDDPLCAKMDSLIKEFREVKGAISDLKTQQPDVCINRKSKQTKSQNGRFRGMCYKCKRYGVHMARDCPLNSKGPAPGE